jgi:hypothetical protein
MGLGISIVCVIAILNLIQRYLEYRSSLETSNVRPNDNNNPPTEKIITKGRTAKQFLYVFGNLLSQGICNISIILLIEELQDLNRWTLSIEKIGLSTGCWCLDPGRFLLRPGLHINPLHLRRDTNQSSSDQLDLRPN